jgi:hypothetical protein
MHWLLIGAAVVLAVIGFCTAVVRLVIDLLRVVDEKSQAPASNDESHTSASRWICDEARVAKLVGKIPSRQV